MDKKTIEIESNSPDIEDQPLDYESGDEVLTQAIEIQSIEILDAKPKVSWAGNSEFLSFPDSPQSREFGAGKHKIEDLESSQDEKRRRPSTPYYDTQNSSKTDCCEGDSTLTQMEVSVINSGDEPGSSVLQEIKQALCVCEQFKYLESGELAPVEEDDTEVLDDSDA